MSTARAPLLPNASAQELPPPTRYLVRNHPIFLRACHSPWTFIPQTTLTWARGVIVVYLTILLPVVFKIAIGHAKSYSAWAVAFDFSVISFVLLWLYHAIVFTWANTHCRWAEIDEDETSWRARLLRVMSPPVQRPGDRKRFWYSLFYTVSQVFALISALVYWAVLAPQGHGYSVAAMRLPAEGTGLLSGNWWKSYWVANIWVVTVLIVFFEAMFLNNVKRQEPVSGHVIGLMALLALYVDWAAVGKQMTGYTSYSFLAPDVVRSRIWSVLYAVGFIALGPLGFGVLYGLIGVRQKATRRQA